MLNVMQHRNLLLSVHKVDGDGYGNGDDNHGGNDDYVEHDDDLEDDGDGTPKILNIMQRENPRCLFICLELLRPRFLTVSKGGQGHR